MWCALVCALASVVFEVGCGGDDPQPLSRLNRPAAPDTASPTEPAATEAVLSDADALSFLHDECASCHGPKPSGARDAAWPMPVALTREWLEVTESTTAVYEALLRKQRGTTGALPAPMPPAALDAAASAKLAAVVRWFQQRLPFTVIDADVRHGRTPQARPEIAFQCKTDATLRTFFARLTNAALEREPSAEELAVFPDSALDAAVTHEQRAVLVSKLAGEWKAELKATGLYKLASAISGAGKIVTPSTAGPSPARDALPPGVDGDLDNELYQLMVASYDTYEYSQYFLGNTVMTTPRTAPIYGCAAGAAWQACELQAPRNGYFTTLGFLNTMPQTFLSPQNNYGRVQAMYLTLVREGLPRSGAPGGAAPKSAACIDTTDTRLLVGALFPGAGTAAQLEMGAACQGCHLGRGLAAGSVLFRPFSTTGLVYSAATLGAAGTPDTAAFAGATGSAWARPAAPGGAAVPVDAAFLRTILAAPPKACLPTGDPAGPLMPVSDVSALASTFMSDRHALTRGFVRHAQVAFGGTELMSLEMANRAIASVESGRSRIGHLIEAYFMADSFACGAVQ